MTNAAKLSMLQSSVTIRLVNFVLRSCNIILISFPKIKINFFSIKLTGGRRFRNVPPNFDYPNVTNITYPEYHNITNTTEAPELGMSMNTPILATSAFLVFVLLLIFKYLLRDMR